MTPCFLLFVSEKARIIPCGSEYQIAKTYQLVKEILEDTALLFHCAKYAIDYIIGPKISPLFHNIMNKSKFLYGKPDPSDILCAISFTDAWGMPNGPGFLVSPTLMNRIPF